jgi:beta-ureidopropionase
MRLIALLATVVAAGEYRADGSFPTAPLVDVNEPMTAIPSVEDALEKYLPEKELAQVKRILYGKGSKAKAVPAAVQAAADAANFQIVYEDMTQNAMKEQMREPRVVRVATIQTAIVHQPKDGASLKEQYDAILARTEQIIDQAGALGVNVLGLQETWTCPFFFATREKYPYAELGEDVREGPTFKFISRLARKYNMVIISPILERDLAHSEKIWNTAVVVGNHGNYIGRHRKNHIPRVGDFNEATYYSEGDSGHPVFETAFGKIAINICYGRHHPLNWFGFMTNGAEMVFNPSATVGALSEPMWPIEARAAAIFNSYFTINTNRIGTEWYPNAFTSGNGGAPHNDFGHFYGSSYVAAPDAARSTGLSRVRDGLLAVDIDLNQVRQIRDVWMLQITGRHALYAELLNRYVSNDFKPQVIRDPAMNAAVEPKNSYQERYPTDL